MKRSVLAGLPILALVGCSAPNADRSPPATITQTVVQTIVTTPSSLPPSTPPPTLETSQGESNGASVDPPTDQDPATPVPVDTSKKGQQLGLVDFFNPNVAWKEDRFDIGSAKQVLGIATDVNQCLAYADTTLEMRLANNFDTLQFKAGQGNSSTSSSQTMLVEITVNGRQADIKRVPFNKIQPITVSVKDVNALIISVYEDKVDNQCQGEAFKAVLTDVRLS